MNIKQWILRASPAPTYYLIAALIGWSWNPHAWPSWVAAVFTALMVFHVLSFWREARRAWFPRIASPGPAEVKRRIEAISPYLEVTVWTTKGGQHYMSVQDMFTVLYRLPVPDTYPQLIAVLDIIRTFARLNSLTHDGNENPES